MKKPTKELSKAAMIAEKDRAIVHAARESFLRDGFARASMDVIAKAAGVSVKTIYSHFENKSDLFSKVMIAACTDHLLSEEIPSEDVLSDRISWFRDATRHGLMEAGREYLRHLLSEEQLSLYRVVTQDSGRYPELGVHYQTNVAQGRTNILIAYLRNLARTNAWKKRDLRQDAALYEALLRGGIYEQALHGLVSVDSDLIDRHARSSSKAMWKFLSTDCG